MQKLRIQKNKTCNTNKTSRASTKYAKKSGERVKEILDFKKCAWLV